jgi:hypothetical protein
MSKGVRGGRKGENKGCTDQEIFLNFASIRTHITSGFSVEERRSEDRKERSCAEERVEQVAYPYQGMVHKLASIRTRIPCGFRLLQLISHELLL